MNVVEHGLPRVDEGEHGRTWLPRVDGGECGGTWVTKGR